MITHSFVMAVLNSHGMFERQMRWLGRILPDTWEAIIVDDESTPQLALPPGLPRHVRLIRHVSNRQRGEWTQKEALNAGVRLAAGQYIVKSDVDHIFTPEAVAVADQFDGDMLLFERRAGHLSETLSIERLDHPVHSPVDDIYVLRRWIFDEHGGYPVTRQYGDTGKFLWSYSRRAEAQPRANAPIYVCPDTHEQYHDLERILP
jgi:hypothetical protein